jgi:hypothetical protein
MMDNEWYEQQQRELDEMQKNPNAVSQDYQAFQLREQEKGLIREQLSLANETETIENLLRGRMLKEDKNGNVRWEDPTDSDMIILTEYGVHLIMNTVHFYLNKNTLLSNYETDIILQKMEDFATSLADVVFMEYEKVFRYPTFDECKEKLMARIDAKVQLRKFANELLGKQINERKIKQEFLDEMEDKIEKEISKIKEQIMKNKLKRFDILIREVQDAVHSTYLRAWNGQERRTLRQHITVNENVNAPIQMPKRDRGMLGGMFRR